MKKKQKRFIMPKEEKIEAKKPSVKPQEKPVFGNKSVNIREIGFYKTRVFWLKASIGLSVVLIIILGIQLIGTIQIWQAQETQRQKLLSQMHVWEDIANKYPSYRDAYFEEALLSYRLGDTERTKEALEKLSLIDPNFPYAKKLEMLSSIR